MATTASTTDNTTQSTIAPNLPLFSRPLLFSQDTIKQLSSSDFLLDKDNLVRLKYEDCIMILFYADNIESRNLAEIWSTAAANSIGAIFAACHLGLEKPVAAAFSMLRGMPAHPLYWCRLQGYPFILVYRQGWPQGFYNSERATQPIIDFSFGSACDPSYVEHENKFLSAQADINLQMTGAKMQTLSRTSSLDYTVANPARGYDPQFPVIAVGKDEVNPDALQVPTTVTQTLVANTTKETSTALPNDIAIPIKPATVPMVVTTTT
jgi:hypothetical protein